MAKGPCGAQLYRLTGFTERLNLIQRLCLALSIAMLVATQVGCTTPPTSTLTLQVKADVVDAARRYEIVYRLQPGDQLEVFLNRHPDYSRKLTVRPDGFITLPLVDEVKVTEKTPKDLAEELKRLFAVRLKDPEVNVIVLNPPEPVVYVVGEVGAPRALPLRQATTVAQALAQSGGATRGAQLGAVSVIRLNELGYLEALSIEIPEGHDGQPDAYMALAAMALKPNDLVLVPESARSQILRVLQDTSIAIAPLFNVLLLREIYVTN